MMYSMFDFTRISVHGGASHQGGFADQLGHYLKSLEVFLSKEPDQIFAALFPGIEQLNNIHPLLVHFPIAFLFGFLLIDVIATLLKQQSLHNTASVLLYLGSISAILAVVAGIQASATVPHGDNVHNIMMQHKNLGITVAVLSSLLSLWRFVSKGILRPAMNFFHLLIAFITCFILVLGMDLGGLMVYHYGVAVNTVKQQQQHHHHIHNGGHSHHH